MKQSLSATAQANLSPFPIPVSTGGTTFVGFTDADKSIASITVTVNGDIVGLDDVRTVPIRTRAGLARAAGGCSCWTWVSCAGASACGSEADSDIEPIPQRRPRSEELAVHFAFPSNIGP